MNAGRASRKKPCTRSGAWQRNWLPVKRTSQGNAGPPQASLSTSRLASRSDSAPSKLPQGRLEPWASSPSGGGLGRPLPDLTHDVGEVRSHPARPVGVELSDEGVESLGVERGAHAAHELQVVVQVMRGGQHAEQHFAAAVEMVQIGARELSAGGAGAGVVKRSFVLLEAGVADAQIAEAGEQVAVARIACGHDAIEQVDARAHTVHQIFRRAHAHEVTRLVGGQARRGVAQQAQHVVFGLAHAQAADGVAGQIERGEAV